MKSPPFIFHQPPTVAAALDLLGEYGDDAKVLAGGQSLIPLMALRLGRPAHVIDIGRCRELDRIDVRDGGVTIGALATHGRVERSEEVRLHAPLVHETMPWIAHRAIRTRGTVVGSIAHGDPAAEMPAVVVATGATLVAASAVGQRSIAADDFFQGYLSTALRPDELLIEVELPAWPETSVGSIDEVSRRHGDYALVGVVTRLDIIDGTITDAALAYFGAASTAVRVAAAEQLLVGATPSPALFAEVALLVADRLSPPADNHGSQSYRKHLAGVLTERGLNAAVAKQSHGVSP